MIRYRFLFALAAIVTALFMVCWRMRKRAPAAAFPAAAAACVLFPRRP